MECDGLEEENWESGKWKLLNKQKTEGNKEWYRKGNRLDRKRRNSGVEAGRKQLCGKKRNKYERN